MLTSEILLGEYHVLYILLTSWSLENSALFGFAQPSRSHGWQNPDYSIKHPVAVTYLFCIHTYFSLSNVTYYLVIFLYHYMFPPYMAVAPFLAEIVPLYVKVTNLVRTRCCFFLLKNDISIKIGIRNWNWNILMLFSVVVASIHWKIRIWVYICWSWILLAELLYRGVDIICTTRI